MDGILSPVLLSLNVPGFMLEAATTQRVPTMFHRSWYVQQRGLASYGAGATSLVSGGTLARQGKSQVTAAI